MIVPMKKVSFIIREKKKDETLKKLRKLGIVHIEITEGSGERLASLQEQIALLESAIFTIGKRKNVEQKDVGLQRHCPLQRKFKLSMRRKNSVRQSESLSIQSLTA